MTQQEIQAARNAFFSGGTFYLYTLRGHDVLVRDKRISIDGFAIAKAVGSALYVTVVNNRNKTAVDLLNALPNVTIESDNGIYKLNGNVWDGMWYRVVADLYKHDEDL